MKAIYQGPRPLNDNQALTQARIWRDRYERQVRQTLDVESQLDKVKNVNSTLRERLTRANGRLARAASRLDKLAHTI